MKVKAFVLCGGKGKRLRPLTYYFQKVMIPIGVSQKPLLEYILALLKKHGIREATLLAGYKHEQIKNYFGDGSKIGMKLNIVIDDPNLGGTGGAVINAYRKGEAHGYDHILIYYGDILSNTNLSEMLKYHVEMRADLTLAISKGYRIEVGVVDLEKGWIKSVKEKPVIDLNVGIGILAMRSEVLKLLDKMVTEAGSKSVDLMGDLLPRMLKEGRKLAAYVIKGVWYDVGSVDRYEKLDISIVKKVEEYLGWS